MIGFTLSDKIPDKKVCVQFDYTAFGNNRQIVQEGFIPHSYCAPVNTQLAEMAIKKKLPRDQSLGTTADLLDGDIPIENCDDNVSGLMGLQSSLKHSQASLNSEPDF